mgnify:CR=1 FL=1
MQCTNRVSYILTTISLSFLLLVLVCKNTQRKLTLQVRTHVMRGRILSRTYSSTNTPCEDSAGKSGVAIQEYGRQDNLNYLCKVLRQLDAQSLHALHMSSGELLHISLVQNIVERSFGSLYAFSVVGSASQGT